MGLFNRLKTWAFQEIPKSKDVNAEFDNVINHMKPSFINSYSSTVAQMKTQLSPGDLGTEVLAQSSADEFAQLRFVIARITGNPFWYQAPASDLATLNSVVNAISAIPQNRIVSGRSRAGSSQGIFLVPSGSTNAVTLKATATNFKYVIANTAYTVSADVTASGLSLAPAAANTATVNDATLAGGLGTKYVGETDILTGNSLISGTFPTLPASLTISGAGAQITALIGSFAAFKSNTTGECFIAYIASATQLTSCFRGYFFDSTDAPIPRGVLTNGNTLTLLKLTWVFVGTTGTIAATYNNPVVGGTQPASASTGDYWFDTTVMLWKTFNGASWITANATLVGICAQDTTKTLAARSFDVFKPVQATNTIQDGIIVAGLDQVVGEQLDSQVNVFGSPVQYKGSVPSWKISQNLDSGVVPAANSELYLYIKENGTSVLSDIAPYDRSRDLLGWYHPYQTWRCVGVVLAAGVSTFGTSYRIAGGVAGTVLKDEAVTTRKIKDLNVTAAKIANATITSTKVAAQGIAQSNLYIRTLAQVPGAGNVAFQGPTSGSTSSTVGTTILELGVTTTGRPVKIEIYSPSAAGCSFSTAAVVTGNIAILRDDVVVFITQFGLSGSGIFNPILNFLDTPAGYISNAAHDYKLQISSNTGGTSVTWTNVGFMAYEI